MTDKLHEVWWDLVLVVLRVVGYFLEGFAFISSEVSPSTPWRRIRVRTHNIFVAYVVVKRLKNWGFYAEWEPG